MNSSGEVKVKAMTSVEAAAISRQAQAVGFAAEGGVMHALVDCACGAVIYREVSAARLPAEVLLSYVLVYSTLAFGLQWMLGLFSDLRGAHRALAAAGPWLTAAGVIAGSVSAWTGAALAGVGNACFHVGVAGALLPRCAGRALEPGIFVGAGALGIFAGVWMGAHVSGWQGVMVALLVAAGIRLWLLLPREEKARSPRAETEQVPWGLAIVVALFVSVVIRSVVAGVLTAGWRSSVPAGLALAVAAGCGKCLGGWLADRFGWQRTAALALVASAPLVFAGLQVPAPGSLRDAAIPEHDAGHPGRHLCRNAALARVRFWSSQPGVARGRTPGVHALAAPAPFAGELSVDTGNPGLSGVAVVRAGARLGTAWAAIF